MRKAATRPTYLPYNGPVEAGGECSVSWSEAPRGVAGLVLLGSLTATLGGSVDEVALGILVVGFEVDVSGPGVVVRV